MVPSDRSMLPDISPLPVMISPFRLQRTFQNVLLPDTLTSDVSHSLSGGFFSQPLAIHTFMVCPGMAKGIPAISILVVTSQYSPGAPKAREENALTAQARLAMVEYFMGAFLMLVSRQKFRHTVVDKINLFCSIVSGCDC